MKKINYFCPNCGEKELYEDNLDDYYLGTASHCQSCKQVFFIQEGGRDFASFEPAIKLCISD